MSRKKANSEVTLNVNVQMAVDTFEFIRNEKITFLEREEKSNFYSVCDAVDGRSFYCCFWDRHPIKDLVFKCPVRKVYVGEKQTHSAANGNSYEIRDTVNAVNFYYETDGNFCSEECMWAFLDEEELRNPMFSKSKQLILSIRGTKPKAAPHWRLLREYGGTLTIEKFRESFKNKMYVLEEITSGFYPFCYKFKEFYHL
jgi:hypothetical protein